MNPYMYQELVENTTCNRIGFGIRKKDIPIKCKQGGVRYPERRRGDTDALLMMAGMMASALGGMSLGRIR